MYNNEILEKLINEELNDYGYLNADAKIEESIEMDKDEINEFLCEDDFEFQFNENSYLVNSGTVNDLFFILISNCNLKPIALELREIDTNNIVLKKLF